MIAYIIHDIQLAKHGMFFKTTRKFICPWLSHHSSLSIPSRSSLKNLFNLAKSHHPRPVTSQGRKEIFLIVAKKNKTCPSPIVCIDLTGQL